MNLCLEALSDIELHQIADAIRSGRLRTPFTELGVRHCCPRTNAGDVAKELNILLGQSASLEGLGNWLVLLASERAQRESVDNRIELVWTGPESTDVPSRDTAVVVRELFKRAKSSVLVAGYAIFQGKQVFSALAEQMAFLPDLHVEMYLDVQRPYGDTTVADDILRRFIHRFKFEEWPGTRLPNVFYDPRSLALDQAKRSSLHAKCVVVDEICAFVSSANFTDAAQNRNIEVGTLVESPRFASKLADQFRNLAAGGVLHCLHF